MVNDCRYNCNARKLTRQDPNMLHLEKCSLQDIWLVCSGVCRSAETGVHSVDTVFSLEMCCKSINGCLDTPLCTAVDLDPGSLLHDGL